MLVIPTILIDVNPMISCGNGPIPAAMTLKGNLRP